MSQQQDAYSALLQKKENLYQKNKNQFLHFVGISNPVTDDRYQRS
jgi:hypothetical protein